MKARDEASGWDVLTSSGGAEDEGAEQENTNKLRKKEKNGKISKVFKQKNIV